MSEIFKACSCAGSRIEDDPNNMAICNLGVDMVGPFKRSKDKKTHLLVAVDKFTKWVEAEPVSKCDAATAVQFIKKVIFRFGFPHSIITDDTSSRMCSRSQNSFIAPLDKLVPLSVMMLCGKPKRKITFFIN